MQTYQSPAGSSNAEVWVAAETGRVCYTEADVAKMKAADPRAGSDGWASLYEDMKTGGQ